MNRILESNVLNEKSKKTIKKALKVLGKKNIAFIMHNGSFPSVENQNTGFGSINSDGGHEFIEYISGLFDAIQLGPAGKQNLAILHHIREQFFPEILYL